MQETSAGLPALTNGDDGDGKAVPDGATMSVDAMTRHITGKLTTAHKRKRGDGRDGISKADAIYNL